MFGVICNPCTAFMSVFCPAVSGDSKIELCSSGSSSEICNTSANNSTINKCLTENLSTHAEFLLSAGSDDERSPDVKENYGKNFYDKEEKPQKNIKGNNRCKSNILPGRVENESIKTFDDSEMTKSLTSCNKKSSMMLMEYSKNKKKEPMKNLINQYSRKLSKRNLDCQDNEKCPQYTASNCQDFKKEPPRNYKEDSCVNQRTNQNNLSRGDSAPINNGIGFKSASTKNLINKKSSRKHEVYNSEILLQHTPEQTKINCEDATKNQSDCTTESDSWGLEGKDESFAKYCDTLKISRKKSKAYSVKFEDEKLGGINKFNGNVKRRNKVKCSKVENRRNNKEEGTCVFKHIYEFFNGHFGTKNKKNIKKIYEVGDKSERAIKGVKPTKFVDKINDDYVYGVKKRRGKKTDGMDGKPKPKRRTKAREIKDIDELKDDKLENVCDLDEEVEEITGSLKLNVKPSKYPLNCENADPLNCENANPLNCENANPLNCQDADFGNAANEINCEQINQVEEVENEKLNLTEERNSLKSEDKVDSSEDQSESGSLEETSDVCECEDV